MTRAPRLHWDAFLRPGQCVECHAPAGSAHEFEPVTAADGCFSCHADRRLHLRDPTSPHAGLPQGCLECHDAHGGADRYLLKTGSLDEQRALCLRCHLDEFTALKFRHAPFEKGACSECHDPHSAPESWLLKSQPTQDLCGRCHEKFVGGIREATSTHDPSEVDCSGCHDPHGAPRPMLLMSRVPWLCEGCHSEVVELARSDEPHASAMFQGRTCLNCHDPHYSSRRRLLRKSEQALCLGCHDRQFESKTGELKNIKRWLGKEKRWHEPIRGRDDACGVCHDAHGRGGFRLLKRSYPDGLYADFDPDTFALCLECHEDRIVLERRTTDATLFRDGDLNLHFVHVSRRERGRSCRACHEPHASSSGAGVRSTVPYGSWEMPLEFIPHGEGGSCRTGCHEMRSYSREAATCGSGECGR